MTLDVAMGMLACGGAFVTKIFQGVGIEGLISAAKIDSLTSNDLPPWLVVMPPLKPIWSAVIVYLNHVRGR